MRDQSLYSLKYTLNMLKQDTHLSLFHAWRRGGASDCYPRNSWIETGFGNFFFFFLINFYFVLIKKKLFN